MDGGSEGVCKTCAEERTSRRENSALQREYVVETVVARCNYCRAAEDESTVLDHDGYCEACRALPRCVQHEDLIAVGHCKTCRREFCRKCLGFTDVCQDCTAKSKTKTKSLKEKAPTAGAGTKSPKAAPKKAKPTEPAVAKAKTGGIKGKPGSKPPAEPNTDAEKKASPSLATRGRKSLEQRLENQAAVAAAGRKPPTLVAVASVLAIGILALVSGAYLHAMSPEEQAKRMKHQMVQVHRGVVHYMKTMKKAPRDEGEIRRALNELKVPGASKIAISVGANQPSCVIYKPSRSGGFIVQATNERGELILDGPGSPAFLDQYFDSSKP